MLDGSANEGFKIQLCWQFEMNGRDAVDDVYPVNRKRLPYSGQLYPRVRQARQTRVARHDLHAVPIEPVKAITVGGHSHLSVDYRYFVAFVDPTLKADFLARFLADIETIADYFTTRTWTE